MLISQDGEATGTVIRWFTTGGTEGFWYRVGEVPPDLALLRDGLGLLAVYAATPDEARLGAKYVVVFGSSKAIEISMPDSVHYLVGPAGITAILFARDTRQTFAATHTYILPPRTD